MTFTSSTSSGKLLATSSAVFEAGSSSPSVGIAAKDPAGRRNGIALDDSNDGVDVDDGVSDSIYFSLEEDPGVGAEVAV